MMQPGVLSIGECASGEGGPQTPGSRTGDPAFRFPEPTAGGRAGMQYISLIRDGCMFRAMPNHLHRLIAGFDAFRRADFERLPVLLQCPMPHGQPPNVLLY